jgi:hypothetical protein
LFIIYNKNKQWHSGAMAHWYNGSVAQWQSGTIAKNINNQTFFNDF